MRTILLFITLSLYALSLSAQVGFGVEGGIGIAGMKFAPSQYPIYYTAGSASPVMATKVGALLDVPMNKHLYFQSGFYAYHKGAVRSFSYHLSDSFNESVHQTLQLYYGTVPVMLLYKFGMQGKERLIAGIGADVAYLLGGSNKITDNYTSYGIAGSNSGTTPVVAGQTVRGFDIGLALCAGFELGSGAFLRICYTTGNQDIGMGTEISKNRSGCITGGWIFGRGRNINKEADDLIDHSEVKGQK